MPDMYSIGKLVAVRDSSATRCTRSVQTVHFLDTIVQKWSPALCVETEFFRENSVSSRDTPRPTVPSSVFLSSIYPTFPTGPGCGPLLSLSIALDLL